MRATNSYRSANRQIIFPNWLLATYGPLKSRSAFTYRPNGSTPKHLRGRHMSLRQGLRLHERASPTSSAVLVNLGGLSFC
jgi:hypothetical protein